MTERSTPDLFASRVPVHSALVQKSVTTSTNSAGRLSPWMLGNREGIRKWKIQNSWQEVCYGSFLVLTKGEGRPLSKVRFLLGCSKEDECEVTSNSTRASRLFQNLIESAGQFTGALLRFRRRFFQPPLQQVIFVRDIQSRQYG